MLKLVQFPGKRKLQNEPEVNVSKGSNSKQAYWVLVGSLSGFLFSILSSVILSRYLDKIEYGTYKQIIYIYDTLLVVFALGLPRAYSFFLPRIKVNQAKHVIRKINNILLIAGLAMGAGLFFGAESISALLKNEELSEYLKVFSVIPIMLLPTMGLEGTLASFKKTQWLAIYNISTKAMMLAFVTAPVIIWDGDVGSAIIGFSVASFMSLILAKYLQNLPFKDIKSERSEVSYKEIFDFSLPLLFAGLWGVVISSSDQFFISYFFGAETFAEYSNGALQLPFVTMVIAATSIVLAPVYSQKAFDATEESRIEIFRIWHSVFEKTIKITYPLVVFFVFFSTEVMVILYGAEYEVSGGFFQIKLIVNFFTVVAYGPLLLSIGGNKFYYKVHMYGAVILIALQIVSVGIIKSPYIVVWVSVVCQVGRILAMLFFISCYFKLKTRRLVPWMMATKVLIPSLIFCYVIKCLLEIVLPTQDRLLMLTLAGLIYIVAYASWAYFTKINYLFVIDPLLNKLHHRN